jgi:hypothetical protein
MTRTKTLISLALTAGLGLAQAAHAGVEWNISVGLPGPIQVSVPAPVYVQAAPAAPALPNIEQMQAQQQARIQWGSQVGLITGHEYYRLQQTQSYIEQQRQWAYADGWLTYDEQQNLINLLNGASQQIERALVNWQRVNTSYYPMPPVLTLWNMPPAYPQGHHHGHHGQRPPPAVPVQAVVQTKPPVYGQRPPAALNTQPTAQPPAQPQTVPQHPGHREQLQQMFPQESRQDVRPMKF